MSTIFVNYRRDDVPGDARGIYEALAARFGRSSVFIDVQNLSAGQRYDKKLEAALSTCDVFVAVVGQRWMSLLKARAEAGHSDHALEEISVALKRGIVVIPVCVGHVSRIPELPRRDELPVEIQDMLLYQKHEISHEHFQRDASDLARAIESAGTQDKPSRAAPSRRPVARTAPRGGKQNAAPKRAEIAAARLFENIPPRDLNFTGRSPFLEQLDALLWATGKKRSTDRVAIHGFGGIGKSTIAIEYAHKSGVKYSGVWWARADEREVLIQSLAMLAIRLDHTLAAETDSERAATAGLSRLASFDKPFLLIYDNAVSADVVTGLIPSENAKVLITSRWPDWAGRASEFKLEVFDEGTASEFIQRRAHRNDEAGARRLAAALGYLPLALDHAGAYCKLTGLGFDRYRSRIDEAIARSPRGSPHPESVAATFGLAIESAVQRSPAAEAMLGMLAFLAPERIELDLIPGSIVAEFDKGEALSALYGVSLLEHETDASGATTATLHPLVQSAMRVRLAEKGKLVGTRSAVAESLSTAFPANSLMDHAAWPKCANMLQHALAFREHCAPNVDDANAAFLFENVAAYLHARGSYAEAEKLYRQAIAITERLHDTAPARLSTLASKLGQLLSTVGRYDEADKLLRRSITDGEAALGSDSLEVAERKNNLARMLSDTKRYAEAEPLYRSAIAIADRPIGGDALSALAWRNNLGILLNETGRNSEAEPLYREAMTIGRRSGFSRHHELARCMNNLGGLLRDTGHAGEAEILIREALGTWKELLGENHAIYARGQENLAKALLALNRDRKSVV